MVTLKMFYIILFFYFILFLLEHCLYYWEKYKNTGEFRIVLSDVTIFFTKVQMEKLDTQMWLWLIKYAFSCCFIIFSFPVFLCRLFLTNILKNWETLSSAEKLQRVNARAAQNTCKKRLNNSESRKFIFFFSSYSSSHFIPKWCSAEHLMPGTTARAKSSLNDRIIPAELYRWIPDE